MLKIVLKVYAATETYSQEMRKFEAVLEKANQTIYNPAGLNFLTPRKCAYLFVSSTPLFV